MEATQTKDSDQNLNEELDEDLVEERLRAELESQVRDSVRHLSTERLSTIVDMMAYWKDKEEWEATQEILAIPNIKENIAAAERQIEKGERIQMARD